MTLPTLHAAQLVTIRDALCFHAYSPIQKPEGRIACLEAVRAVCAIEEAMSRHGDAIVTVIPMSSMGGAG